MSNLIDRAVEALAEFWRARAQRRAIKRAIAELESYDDLLLKDIGVPRNSIREFVEGRAQKAAAAKAPKAPARSPEPGGTILAFASGAAAGAADDCPPDCCRTV